MGITTLRNIAMTVLGFVMVLSPLALWVAWTETIFYGILMVFGLAFCLLCLIENLSGPDDGY